MEEAGIVSKWPLTLRSKVGQDRPLGGPFMVLPVFIDRFVIFLMILRAFYILEILIIYQLCILQILPQLLTCFLIVFLVFSELSYFILFCFTYRNFMHLFRQNYRLFSPSQFTPSLSCLGSSTFSYCFFVEKIFIFLYLTQIFWNLF